LSVIAQQVLTIQSAIR